MQIPVYCLSHLFTCLHKNNDKILQRHFQHCFLHQLLSLKKYDFKQNITLDQDQRHMQATVATCPHKKTPIKSCKAFPALLLASISQSQKLQFQTEISLCSKAHANNSSNRFYVHDKPENIHEGAPKMKQGLYSCLLIHTAIFLLA